MRDPGVQKLLALCHVAEAFVELDGGHLGVELKAAHVGGGGFGGGDEGRSRT